MIHFSNYAIVEEKDVVENPQTNDNIFSVFSILMSSIIGLYICIKKK